MSFTIDIYTKKVTPQTFVGRLTIHDCRSRRQVKLIIKQIFGRNVIIRFLEKETI